jgi:hypothetical protein
MLPDDVCEKIAKEGARIIPASVVEAITVDAGNEEPGHRRVGRSQTSVDQIFSSPLCVHHDPLPIFGRKKFALSTPFVPMEFEYMFSLFSLCPLA